MMHIPSLARSALPRVSSLARSSYRSFAVAASSPSSASAGAAKFIGRQAVLSVVIGTVSSGAAAVALCDDGKDDGSGDDIMTKLKSMIPSTDGDGGFDVSSMADKVATEVGSKVAEAIETGVPTQLSYGFMSGFCSGYALKKVGKAAGIVLGMGFMALQTLAYSGYVEVDHGKLKKDIEGMMDLNKDGKIDKEDLDKASAEVLKVLEFGLPAGAGFGAGFVFGLKQG